MTGTERMRRLSTLERTATGGSLMLWDCLSENDLKRLEALPADPNGQWDYNRWTDQDRLDARMIMRKALGEGETNASA